MTSPVDPDLSARLSRLERGWARQRAAFVFTLLLGAVSSSWTSAESLPDPMVRGKRVPRQGAVSGLLIADADGDERGGYVTEAHGDAFLTLDAKQGQQTIFIANRDGGANLSVWSGTNRNDNYVSIRAVPTPLIEIVQGGKKVFTAGGPNGPSK